MRFTKLDLHRYGALTGRVLDFRQGAALHVVYGPNEAGKSSALSAISDLLFGFPNNAEQNFLHELATLRVGAEIEARDGRRLQFRRRRGRKNTLIAPTDAEQALADDALSPFLGGLGRDIFERAFGLNSHRLREGAEAMLHSGGEIGSLLFSAASGLTGLTRLRHSLETEADGIFAQRRSKDRSFYQVLDRHDDARKAERDNELKSGDWKKLLSEAESVEAEISALQSERQETKRGLDRLRMLGKLEPLMREIDMETAELEGFADLDAAPSTFADNLASALEAKKIAEERMKSAQEEVVRVKDGLKAAHVDRKIFAADTTIIELYAEKGAYLKVREDLPRVQGEVEDFDVRLLQLARKLGLAAVDELERAQPSAADLARLRLLVEDGRNLRRRDADIGKRLAEEREYLRHLEGLETGGRLIDPKPYSEQLAALQPDLSELGRLDVLHVKAARARADLEDAVGRLLPAVSDLDALLSRVIPDVATLSEHRRLLDEAGTAARDAAQALAGIGAEKALLERDIANLAGGGVIATRQDIADARARRDALVAALSGKAASAKMPEIEFAIRDADRLADLALTDAERVARHAQFTARLGQLEQDFSTAQDRDTEAKTSLSTAVDRYEALFAGSGVRPLGADRMIDWRRAIETLAKQRNDLNDLLDELAVLRLAEERVHPALTALADASGLSGSAALPPTALGRALVKHIGDLAARWTESRSAAGKRASAVEAIEKFEAEAGELRAEVGRWELVFADAAALIGLSEEATVEMADAALDAWKELPPSLAERENRRRRVQGMHRDANEFEEKVKVLTVDAASDLASLSADAAVDVLHQRAVAANSDEQRRKGLVESLERAERLLERCQAGVEATDAVLEEFQHSVPDMPDLHALLKRLQERDTLLDRLKVCRKRFVEQAEGRSEDEVRLSLADFDRVDAVLEIERLEALDHEQVERFGQLTARIAENHRQRRALETGVSAEYAVYEKLAAEQDARDLARQWVVLKLAAHMLSTSMESYREAQADPVMSRAGALFSVLTGGRFARLVQEYGADDVLHLKAERSGGERVPLEGLSEGTGDQLYLALRLAFLEDYCGRNEPAPLIVDDIFQTFDDDRTASGLKALAGTSGTFQTILFTHQRSVVEIGRRELEDRMDLIEL